MLLQRGYEVTHETIRSWEFRFAPLLADQLRARRRGRAGESWYVDETLRRECLDHVIVVNERHVRCVLHQYVGHYNRMRPRRSLALDSPEGRPPQRRPRLGRAESRLVLGGLHHEYQWAA